MNDVQKQLTLNINQNIILNDITLDIKTFLMNSVY